MNYVEIMLRSKIILNNNVINKFNKYLSNKTPF